MPPKKSQPLPTLLTIGQLSTRAGVAASALRFYESQGLLRTSRSGKNQRRFDRDALRRVALIRAAQQVGLSLEEIKSALDTLPDDRNASAADWKAMAKQWQGKLDERITIIERLRTDSSACIGCGCMTLNSCTRDNPNDVAYTLGHGPQYWYGHTPADAAAAAIKPPKRNPLQGR
ncbi:MAG: redox-sensitive transcriptional activator SoxR [Actinobacteria bacterium]|nr:redox-sensitive transcriptional activator SoxR [Actinomycetota bacterium]